MLDINDDVVAAAVLETLATGYLAFFEVDGVKFAVWDCGSREGWSCGKAVMGNKALAVGCPDSASAIKTALKLWDVERRERALLEEAINA